MLLLFPVFSALMAVSAATPIYIIYYDANGGTGAPPTQMIYIDLAIPLSSIIPTLQGFTFLGWGKTPIDAYATYQPGGSYSGNSPITLYAVWESKNTVTYDANGGSGTVTVKFHSGGYLNVSTKIVTGYSGIVPTRPGYTLLGWSTNRTAKTPDLAYNELYGQIRSLLLLSNVTVYAVWKEIVYSVSYDANGGFNAPAMQTKKYDVALPLSEAIPIREGYTFLGWSASKTATTATYQAGGSYTVNNDVTLYAIWEENIEIPVVIPQDITPSNEKVTTTADGMAFRGFAEKTTVDTALSYFQQDNSYLQIKDADENVLEGGDIVGTGCTINLLVNEEIQASYAIAVTGDLTGNGIISSTDYIKLSGSLKGQLNLADAFEYAADINNDGSITAADYLLLRGYLKGNVDI